MGEIYPFPSPPAEIDAFSASNAAFEKMKTALRRVVGDGESLDALEDTLEREGREVLRSAMQDALDLGHRQETPVRVEGADGVVRGHHRVRTRAHKTLFGRVTVRMWATGARGVEAVVPRGARLNLRPGMFSGRLRERLCKRAIDLSFDKAIASVEEDTGTKVPKRQAEDIVQAASVDFEAFYEQRAGTPVPDGHILVLSFDGKGVVMCSNGLRAETRKRAETTPKKLEHRLSKGEKAHRKRMAEVAAVYSIAPDVRTPDDLRTGAPGRKRPKPAGKRVWASLERDIPTVVEEAFAEADRRDPGHTARWVVLVDGNAQQISAIRAAAKRHGVTITLTLDLVHVIEYLWRAAWAAHGEGNPRAEGFVSKLLHCILDGRGAAVVHTLRGMARTKTRSTTTRKALRAVASYLHKHASMMEYHQHLADGLPVATGVIEGACRHLVADRMDITGARWGLATAEAILRLRAVRSSGDWDEHWAFHARRELGRNHLSAFADHELPELREAA